MQTLKEAFEYGKKLLKKNNIADWNIDAWYLLEYITKIDRAFYLLHCDDEISTPDWEQYQCLLQKRASHMPLQYIMGEQEFMGLPFLVTPDVLIPRQDTECLVLEVEKNISSDMKILDMCTGSGCIIISLKIRNRDIQATGADISKKALAVARENAQRNQTNVTFLHSDLFHQIQGEFDIILSNPPYVPTLAMESLMEEVKLHEPRIALDGKMDGLEFYRKITKESYRYLKPQGLLFYEIGHDQAACVASIMESEGFLDIGIVQDLAGLDRVVYGGKKHV